jgi:uncharacterized protein
MRGIQKNNTVALAFDSFTATRYYPNLMIFGQLPKYIDPVRMADTRASIKGMMTFAGMDRLEAQLVDKQGEVFVELDFGIDVEGLRFITGKIQTQVSLDCQRCLQKVSYPIECDVSLSPVTTIEEANNLPERYEPCMLAKEILLTTLVEEEILLHLPMIAVHDTEKCHIAAPNVEADEQLKQHPFRQLAELTRKKN